MYAYRIHAKLTKRGFHLAVTMKRKTMKGYTFLGTITADTMVDALKGYLLVQAQYKHRLVFRVR